jgi:hypothetical protein
MAVLLDSFRIQTKDKDMIYSLLIIVKDKAKQVQTILLL